MVQASDWRLESFSVVHIFKSHGKDSQCIYLGYNDKSTDLALRKLHNLGKDCYLRKEISFDNGLKVRLKRGVRGVLQISSSELPGGDSVWYTVLNFSGPNSNTVARYGNDYVNEIMSLISQVNIDRETGILEGTFHTAYSKVIPQGVLFISENMIEYNWALDNFRKNLSFDVSKKSRSINKPGHLYISKIGCYVYLGQFYDRTEERPIKIFTKEVNCSQDSTISSALVHRTWKTSFNTTYLDNNDELVGNKGVLVDEFSVVLGLVVCDKLVFTPDTPNMSDIWSSVVKIVYKDSKTLGKTEQVVFNFSDRVSGMFKTLSLLVDSKDTPTLDDEAKGMLVEMVEFMIKSTIYRRSASPQYTLKNSISDSKQLLTELFDIFSSSYSIPTFDLKVKFFSGLGIDIIDLVNKGFRELVDPDNNDILGINTLDDFRYFIEISERYCNVSVDQKKVKQLSRYYNGPEKEIPKLGDLICPELETIVRDIIAKADKDFGLNVSYYNISEIGNRSNSVAVRKVGITLEDIINHLGGVENVTPDLRNYILTNHFRGIEVESEFNDKIL